MTTVYQIDPALLREACLRSGIARFRICKELISQQTSSLVETEQRFSSEFYSLWILSWRRYHWDHP